MRPETTASRSRRVLHALSRGLSTWVMLSLGLGGLLRLGYEALGEPGWFVWLNLVVVPPILFAAVTSVRTSYRDESFGAQLAGQKWGRSDTTGLVVIVVLLMIGGVLAITLKNLALAGVLTLAVAVFAGVTALIVAGVRATRSSSDRSR